MLLDSPAEFLPLLTNNVTSGDTSDEFYRERYLYHTILAKVAAGGSVVVEGTLDGVTWAPLAPEIDEDAIVTVTATILGIRAVRNAGVQAVTCQVFSSTTAGIR